MKNKTRHVVGKVIVKAVSVHYSLLVTVVHIKIKIKDDRNITKKDISKIEIEFPL